MFDFRQIPLFSLEKRLSMHKMTMVSKSFGGGMAPFAPLATSVEQSASKNYKENLQPLQTRDKGHKNHWICFF